MNHQPHLITLIEQQRASIIRGKSRRIVNDILRSKSLVQRLEPDAWIDSRYPHQGCVNTVQWNHDGSLLISGGDDVTLNIWSYEQRRVIHSIITSHTGNIFCAKFLPGTGDSKIVSCAADSVINVYDMNWSEDKHQSLHRFTNHSGMTHKFALEPGNPHIFLSCSGDGTCRQFDLRSPSTPSIIIDWRQLHEGKSVDFNSIDMNPRDYNYLIAAGGDPYVRLYDRRIVRQGTTSLSCVKQYCPTTIAEKSESQSRYLPIHITGVRYNYLGTEFVATYSGNNIFLFDHNEEEGEDSPDGRIVNNYKQEYSGHRNIRTVKEVNFLGPKHEYILSGSDDGNVFIWDKGTADIVHITRGDKHIVNCLDLHPKYPLCFASSGIEYDIKIWEPTAEDDLSPEMLNMQSILEQNQKVNQQGHSSLLLPASFVVNLMNLMNADDDQRPREERRRIARLINQLALMASEESEEEESEEEEASEGTQCRTQ